MLLGRFIAAIFFFFVVLNSEAQEFHNKNKVSGKEVFRKKNASQKRLKAKIPKILETKNFLIESFKIPVSEDNFLPPTWIDYKPSHLPRKIDSTAYAMQLTKFEMEFGRGKTIPDKIKLPALIALSRYPELSNVNVEFRYDNIRTTMACRPKLLDVFLPASQRSYLILINDEAEKQFIHVDKLSLNAKVGLIGHELAHVMDYESMSTFDIIYTAVAYSFPSFKQDFERETDRMAVKRGFGWQLYDFASYVMTNSKIPREYRAYKRRFYLTPHRIRYFIFRFK